MLLKCPPHRTSKKGKVIPMADQREGVVRHYAKRVMDEDYWNPIITTDPAEIARIHAEIQKEKELSKRYRWEKFPFYGLTLSRAIPIEDEPTGSQ